MLSDLTHAFDFRKVINEKTYECLARFDTHTSDDLERFKLATESLEKEGKRIRIVTKGSRQKAIYILSEDE